MKGDDVKKQFEHAFKGKGTSLWLPPELMEDVCATGSPAEAFARLRNDDLQLSLEERARLLYVAMTRARELVILAMDAGVSRGKVTAPTFDVETDLTYDVLRRILPTDALDMPQLDSDRLVFDNSKPGDYELISLANFIFGEQAFEANASLDAEGRLVRGDADVAIMLRTQLCPVLPTPSPIRLSLCIPRQWACAWASVRSERVTRIATRQSPRRSMPREDRAAEARVPMDESGDDAESDGSEMTDADVAAVEPAGNPMALGSAFHAACQWLIEMGADALPAERADALARLWCLTPEQRERFDVALDRWLKSAVRADLLAWPCIRAEVPFFSLGCEDEDIARYGAYAEGAIDALATDPADPSRALVIDYKTGGTPDETPEQLLEKHALQARVYADVLHKAGFGP
ncbi:MAG: PD-(D/E)XK nuclease family protein [Collinsella sp.]